VRLAKKKGEKIKLKCKCGHTEAYHVNDIMAGTNRMISLLGSGIFLIGTPVVVYLIWNTIGGTHYPYAISALLGGGLMPFLIYRAITKYESDKKRMFNQYKIRNTAEI